jgi:hypothetical protein
MASCFKVNHWDEKNYAFQITRADVPISREKTQLPENAVNDLFLAVNIAENPELTGF